MGSRPGQTKDYRIDIGCVSAKHTALRRKNKDWVLGIRLIWGEMFIRGQLFQRASTIKIQQSVLV